MLIDQAVILIPENQPDSASGGWNAGKKLLGLPVLKRLILTASLAGVKDFILIGGGEEEWGESFSALQEDKRLKERSLQLKAVLLSDLEGTELGKSIKGRFWLMDGSLVIDQELLTRVARAEPDWNKSLHLVDCHPERGEEGRDGVRCRTDGECHEILDFGDQADGKPAAYAGLSLCSAEVFPRLAHILRRRGIRPLDGESMNEIFLPSQPGAFDIGPHFCLKIASPASFQKAERYLIGTARKPTDGFFSRHFNRYLSLFLTRGLVNLDIAPVHLSALSFLIGLMSVWFIGRGDPRSFFLGALLFEFASIFDGCDGETARLTFRASKTGARLDVIGDAIVFVLFFFSLPIGLFNATHERAWLVIGGLALLSMGTFYYILADYIKKAGIGTNIVAVVKDIEKSGFGSGLAGRLDRIASRIAFIYRRDFFATAASLLILLGKAWLLMWLLAILLPLEAMYISYYSKRRLREIRASA